MMVYQFEQLRSPHPSTKMMLCMPPTMAMPFMVNLAENAHGMNLD